MQQQSHTVYRLPVHLENHQIVVFPRGEAQDRLDRPNRTRLTGFFELNRTDEHARQYLYQDIPAHYTWIEGDRVWRLRRERRTNPVISRIYTVNPLDRQRFYLRLLLLYVRGPQSFADLRTVDGRVYQTYAEAANALGLLEDDSIWRACLAESAASDTASQQRYLFATILLNCEPTDSLALYEANKVNRFLTFSLPCRSYRSLHLTFCAGHHGRGFR